MSNSPNRELWRLKCQGETEELKSTSGDCSGEVNGENSPIFDRLAYSSSTKQNEGINKIWYEFIMEFILVQENSGILTCVGIWVELEIIVLC